jgi:hypothetical protein
MKPPPDPDYRHRFPAEIIRHAVRLYHVFSLSLRDVELLLAERGVVAISRLPSVFTATAIIAATETIRPPSRCFR